MRHKCGTNDQALLLAVAGAGCSTAPRRRPDSSAWCAAWDGRCRWRPPLRQRALDEHSCDGKHNQRRRHSEASGYDTVGSAMTPALQHAVPMTAPRTRCRDAPNTGTATNTTGAAPATDLRRRRAADQRAVPRLRLQRPRVQPVATCCPTSAKRSMEVEQPVRGALRRCVAWYKTKFPATTTAFCRAPTRAFSSVCTRRRRRCVVQRVSKAT